MAAARRAIATAAAPPGAWRWDEVRRVALERPVYEAGAGDDIAERYGLLYDFGTDQIVACPARLLSYRAGELAHVLLHEATHAVYYPLARQAAGMTISPSLGPGGGRAPTAS